MASTSAFRDGNIPKKIKTAVNTLSADHQPLVVEIRKSINALQEIAVEMETLNQTQQVKEIEDAVRQLLYANNECNSFSSVMKSIGKNYRPGPELTNFEEMLDDEKRTFEGHSARNLQNDPLLRRFREAVWNVHHADQPMPGEEQEEFKMVADTEIGILNTFCPITGKAVTDLSEPVRSMDCKHVYEKDAIMYHIWHTTISNTCPVQDCQIALCASRVVCDALLPVEIEEMRSQNTQTQTHGAVEDFTTFSDDDSS